MRRSQTGPPRSSPSLAEAFRRGLSGEVEVEARPTRGDRSKYASDPWAYFRDILGGELTQQQDEVLEGILQYDRVGVQAANNVGKTFLLSGAACWFFDAIGAQLDDRGMEQGARLLLPGPNLGTVRATIWGEITQQVERARHRGHAMPGRMYSAVNLTKLWEVRPGWEAEALSPPKKPGEKQAHGAAGRHARNQWAIVEEGAGVHPALWNSILGMCSGYNNKILTAWNPTERSGFVYELTRGPGWRMFVLSAMDHPNVRRRQAVVPAAISHVVMDDAVANECDLVGEAGVVEPSPEHLDFVYAIPPPDATTDEPRDDGIPGHRDGKPCVYRPRGMFGPRRLGQYPRDDSSGLFDPVSWDRAVDRWRETEDPETPPDRVGVDAAGEGRDEVTAAPAWGDSADGLLREWTEAVANGSLEHLETMRAERRVRIGRIQVLSGTDGPSIASEVDELFPRSVICAEDTGYGKSVLDHAASVLRRGDLIRWNPQGPPPDGHPLPDEWLCGNLRAAAYVRAAMLVRRGLVDVPDDPQLRQEIMAIELRWNKTRLVEGESREVVYVIPKNWLKHRLGRSPDRADALVFALAGSPAETDTFGLY